MSYPTETRSNTDTNPKPITNIRSRHEIKTDHYTIRLSNPDSVFVIQVCSPTYAQIHQPFWSQHLIRTSLHISKNISLKLKNYHTKVSSGTSLRPLIGPDSGFSPLPLGPCDFSFTAKARPRDSNSRNLVDLNRASRVLTTDSPLPI